MQSQENILGCLSNRNKGTVSCCISMFSCRGYLLDNDCYASLAGVLTQIQYGSLSRSHQLLRCLGTRFNLIEAGGGGGHCAPYRFLCCCVKTVCGRCFNLSFEHSFSCYLKVSIQCSL